MYKRAFFVVVALFVCVTLYTLLAAGLSWLILHQPHVAIVVISFVGAPLWLILTLKVLEKVFRADARETHYFATPHRVRKPALRR